MCRIVNQFALLLEDEEAKVAMMAEDLQRRSSQAHFDLAAAAAVAAKAAAAAAAAAEETAAAESSNELGTGGSDFGGRTPSPKRGRDLQIVNFLTRHHMYASSSTPIRPVASVFFPSPPSLPVPHAAPAAAFSGGGGGGGGGGPSPPSFLLPLPAGLLRTGKKSVCCSCPRSSHYCEGGDGQRQFPHRTTTKAACYVTRWSGGGGGHSCRRRRQKRGP